MPTRSRPRHGDLSRRHDFRHANLLDLGLQLPGQEWADSPVQHESGQLTQIMDRNGNALDLTYDSSGHLLTVVEADTLAHNPVIELTFTYTGNHITVVSDGTGRTWTYVYNGSGLVEVDYPTNAQTPAAVERYAYYPDKARQGLLSQVTVPNGGMVAFSYYANGKAYQVTDADGFTNVYSYDLYRDRTAYTDARGNTTLYDYDSAGEVVMMQMPNG